MVGDGRRGGFAMARIENAFKGPPPLGAKIIQGCLPANAQRSEIGPAYQLRSPRCT